MRKRMSCAGICVACVLLILLPGCNSEKSASNGPEIHEGDPLTSYSQEITSSIHEFNVKVNETYVLDVTVRNTGTQPWFGHAGVAPVDASYRWLDTKGNVLPIEGKRTALNTVVLQPGASDQLKLQVVAPPNPGSYLLWVSMVQEGVNWFFGKGAKPLALQVTVD